ncbi:right-handed parallel beta-helix repeat-containing protein [Streptomyces bambusae]|uniref:right-handed parallel beta-helix repeat-containing protein n=1 Tax=Streptomyces bambusae TaxID=1550616 RepID=UPI001CFF6562|nr:right-handed parallel beta-helix repeat-containing protein [Streptomyces bambusae]MCB5169533.1 right-handed parallel beta-helix repeat-containing protein [Streptomyces bambusae]
MRIPRCPALLVAAVLLISSCAAPADDAAAPDAPRVLRVPAGYATIQQAVDRARPGDLVLVGPGVYRESVTLPTPRVVLRGTDRNRTVVDGEFRRANGITVTGAGSAVENLTIRHHLANGLLFTGVTDPARQSGAGGGAAYDRLDTRRHPPLRGFRASYVTAHNNALYGIYAFDARDGVIEHAYASGHADSGIYVGQCRPCRTVVRENTVERNAVGLEVTNASEELYFLGNRSHRNRVGVAVNSDDLEALAPQHRAVFAGNTVTDNNEPDSPEQADGGFGIGIGIGGGRDNLVERNLVRGNRWAGILVTDVLGYRATGNLVRGNRTAGNAGDLAPAAPPGRSFRLVTAPPPQPGMPAAASAPARPARTMPAPAAEGYLLPAG